MCEGKEGGGWLKVALKRASRLQIRDGSCPLVCGAESKPCSHRGKAMRLLSRLATDAIQRPILRVEYKPHRLIVPMAQVTRSLRAARISLNICMTK